MGPFVRLTVSCAVVCLAAVAVDAADRRKPTTPPPPLLPLPTPSPDWAFDERPPVAVRVLQSSAFHVPLRAADLISTEIALARPGLHERNPFGKRREMRVLMVVAASAGTTWLDHKWANKKKARWALRIGHGLLTAWVVHHNVGHAERARR
jgi:hypothetical protein